MNKHISINKHTKVLLPAKDYNFETDKRLLVPYTSGEKIGFVNSAGEIIVEPKYAMYYGDCMSESDYIRVSVMHLYGFARSNKSVATYTRPLYGLINYRGEEILKPEYYSIVQSLSNKEIFTIQTVDLQYGVITAKGDVIIPFGKYDWIDGFDQGLARVKLGKQTNGQKDSSCLWGIVDEHGKEILKPEYDDIWKFFGKNRFSTRTIKDDISKEVYFHELNPSLLNQIFSQRSTHYDNDEYTSLYGEFEGSYAQDVMGYSDDVINDAFDGEADAYWNID